MISEIEFAEEAVVAQNHALATAAFSWEDVDGEE
jgi:hypothetical protein